MIVTQTPLRVSFAGGGTDLPEYYREHGGRVLTCAIDKYVYVIAKERFDDKIFINYSRKEIVDSIDQIQHELVREAMRITGVERGIEITTLADIPSEGSGLGSSSSITVGLLNALFLFRGRQVALHDLAALACEIEIERLGKPIGKQDQYIAALGGLQHLEFGPGEAVKATSLTESDDLLNAIQRRLMLFYTNRTRKADTILREQRRNIQKRLVELNTLRDLATELYGDLCAGRIDGLSAALRQGWMAKRELASGISDDAINALIDAALKAGAEGAKISGAGGGGFLLVLCPPAHQDAVREQLAGHRYLAVQIERFGSRAVLNIHRKI